MDLKQQIVSDRVEKISEDHKITQDDAFLKLSYSLILGKSLHDFDPLDVVDGGQDKQMDLISIEEKDDGADIYVIQCKNSEGFSSNAIVLLANGIEWLLSKSRVEVRKISNKALRDKIMEFRSIMNSYGPSNLSLNVRFVTKGRVDKLSDEFRQEMDNLRESIDNGTFELASVKALGASELNDLLQFQERQTKKVDADIKVKYDANNPSLIKYYSEDLKGLVCSVPAFEIARLVNENKDGSIFDLNIRKYLGKRGAVNKDILATCSNPEFSYEFWFLNNGITIVCDGFDPVTDPDNPHVKISNIQIVNGCQTATTLAMAANEGMLVNDVKVLTRIYEAPDPDLVSRIVLTTNNQNQIKSRDLRSNDPVQQDMQKGFESYGFGYERKIRQYEEQHDLFDKIFTNEGVGRWYLSVVLGRPSDARARKYKIWGELYSKVFSGSAIEPYIISSLIGERVLNWIGGSNYVESEDETYRVVAKKGSYHVARVASFLIKGDDNFNIDREELKKWVERLREEGDELDDKIGKAIDIVVNILNSNEDYSSDVDRSLKSSFLDQDIRKHLHVGAHE